MSKTTREPPSYLGPEGAEFFRRTQTEYEFSAEPQWRLLEDACGCIDRIAQARDILSAEGLTVPTGNGGSKTHPAVGVERDARTLLARLLRELQFSDPPDEPRPPRPSTELQRR